MKNILIGSVSIIILLGGIMWLASKQKDTKSPLPASPVSVAINASAPNATFTNLKGASVKLSSFKGKKVMLWLVATWCSSCSEGAHVLEQNESKLGNLIIITLRTHGNAGYPGPKIGDFAAQSAPNTLHFKNWFWGTLTKQSTQIYNPHNYPDIYFLIDKNGVVRDVSDAPAATLNTILKFARS